MLVLRKSMSVSPGLLLKFPEPCTSQSDPSAPTKLISRQDRVVADVVDLILAGHRGGAVLTAQDHVGGGAGRRRRVRRDSEQEAGANDLVNVVDAKRPDS